LAEKTNMMVLRSSLIHEQKCDGRFAGYPANTLPTQRLRL
jgi:hypothetical protein